MTKDEVFGEKIAADGIFSRQKAAGKVPSKEVTKDKLSHEHMTRDEVLGEKIAADGIFSMQTAAGKVSSRETAKDGDRQENGKR